MSIEAKQGSYGVLIKTGNTTKQVSGKLIGYTSKAVFIVNGQYIHVFVEKGGLSTNVGHSIMLNGGEAVMYGNCVGIKKNGRISLYDENGKPAGSRNA